MYQVKFSPLKKTWRWSNFVLVSVGTSEWDYCPTWNHRDKFEDALAKGLGFREMFESEAKELEKFVRPLSTEDWEFIRTLASGWEGSFESLVEAARAMSYDPNNQEDAA